MKKNSGFTLIELLISLAIIGILSTIAIVSYSSYVKKSRRVDGIQTLLAMSLAEEKYRMTNSTYGTLAQVWGGVTASPLGYYTLAISNVTATSYTLTATPNGNQATDSENSTSCSPLSLAISNGTSTQTPTVCWPN